MGLTRRTALQGTAAVGLLGPGSTVPAQALTTARLPVITRESVVRSLPELDRLVAGMLRRTGIPGLSLAVVHEDDVVHLAGFGLQQADRPEPVDADTVFQLASLSKPIAATVVAALAGDGLVAWDDPILRHDPGLALHEAWVTRQVTLRDMFAHRSGLPEHAGDALEDIGYDRAEILRRLRHIRPASGFRSHYAYTNFGLTAAAVAAARAAGKSWEDVSAERLYRPLNMANTSSRFADFQASANRAVGHMRQGTGGAWAARHVRDPDAQSPAGGVSSSARDLARWLRLQLGRGTLDGREVVRATALDETHRPHMISTPPRDPALDRPVFYGLGWGIDYDDRGRVRWSHSGAFNLGAATCVNILPAERLGIVVLTNAQPIGVPEALCRSFLDLAVNGQIERDWLALFGPLLAQAMAPDYGMTVDYARPPAQPSPALPAVAYAGAYESAVFGGIEVAGADVAGLVLKLGPKRQAFALRHFDRDVFSYQPIGENAFGPSAVVFAIGADRKAASVTIENLDTTGQGRFDRARPG
ncbi:serine hydrolase [Belnapia sp. T6]|uniref:Serine hydrolase n=1 Tax=Belnapia mucosa TaxID=2804532 RepID=A0ABS1V8F3_9PROT|nr:serine hydrolase [Belnapia mucosa]MBL6457431.1 serine hydrolase [Belnapia mucosa]